MPEPVVRPAECGDHEWIDVNTNFIVLQDRLFTGLGETLSHEIFYQVCRRCGTTRYRRADGPRGQWTSGPTTMVEWA